MPGLAVYRAQVHRGERGHPGKGQASLAPELKVIPTKVGQPTAAESVFPGLSQNLWITL